MPQIDKLALSFLSELHSDNVKNTFESLSNMLEVLETKDDPDMIELEIADIAYQLIEKLNILSELLKNYVGENNILMGDKIQSLYNDRNSTIFE
jgi:hypothetical protein